jgi:hypothetical protein
VKKNTKERSAKNACKHDQADCKDVHNVYAESEFARI